MFGPGFWGRLDVVVNALDNVKARCCYVGHNNNNNNVVVNALDNVKARWCCCCDRLLLWQARLYVDGRCVFFEKPLLDLLLLWTAVVVAGAAVRRQPLRLL